MSTLEIPPDVAAEVESALNPKDPSSHVFMYGNNGKSCVFILGEKCTEEELRELGVSDDQLKNSNPIKRIYCNSILGISGMLINLRFRFHAHRTLGPWERRNTCRMYRFPEPTLDD